MSFYNKVYGKNILKSHLGALSARLKNLRAEAGAVEGNGSFGVRVRGLR